MPGVGAGCRLWAGQEEEKNGSRACRLWGLCTQGLQPSPGGNGASEPFEEESLSLQFVTIFSSTFGNKNCTINHSSIKSFVIFFKPMEHPPFPGLNCPLALVPGWPPLASRPPSPVSDKTGWPGECLQASVRSLSSLSSQSQDFYLRGRVRAGAWGLRPEDQESFLLSLV